MRDVIDLYASPVPVGAKVRMLNPSPFKVGSVWCVDAWSRSTCWLTISPAHGAGPSLLRTIDELEAV